MSMFVQLLEITSQWSMQRWEFEWLRRSDIRFWYKFRTFLKYYVDVYRYIYLYIPTIFEYQTGKHKFRIVCLSLQDAEPGKCGEMLPAANNFKSLEKFCGLNFYGQMVFLLFVFFLAMGYLSLHLSCYVVFHSCFVWKAW